MRLSRLLQAAGLTCPEEREITALACHCDEVIPGALFAALEGARADGRQFIPEAVERGAAAVLCRGCGEAAVPMAETEEPRRALSLMAAEFYGRPADALTVIAVTGTKGKTTVAHMLREILLAAGYSVGMIGTMGSFLGRERILAAGNTTPEPITLHRLLRSMADEGCTHVVLEASSQGEKLHRLDGVKPDIGIFLNLSPDHIGPGEHESFEEYRSCKRALLCRCRQVVGNADDPAWAYITEHLPPEVPRCAFEPCVIRPGAGLSTLLTLPGRGTYRIPMPGAFNGRNAAAALTAAEVLGVPEEAVRVGLERVMVPGRCMVYPADAPFGVLIDYAHNGASFRALFTALRERGARRIIALFGAGGERPPLRRTEMARAAAEGADFAVITEDNPRSEPLMDICLQIARAMPELPHTIIPNRREAIRCALDLAEPGDVVALLGKGHEQYIETDGRRRYFSEWEVLEEYFSAHELFRFDRQTEKIRLSTNP